MKIHILGTAAAEGFPGLFCRCEHCVKARKLGGKNIRSRSSAIIDDILKVDFPPDSYYHMLRDGIDMAAIKYLLITHAHSDHLQADELENRNPVYAHGIDHPLKIYGHDLALQRCLQSVTLNKDRLELHLIHPYRTFELEKDTFVTPLPADHDQRQTCFIFYIERNGKTLLYGHDTGWFPEETWQWLEGKTLHAALLDNTNGPLPGRRNHMNNEAILEMKAVFESKKMITPDSKIVVTHFSHNCGMMHEDLESFYAPHGIQAAYDGMILTV